MQGADSLNLQALAAAQQGNEQGQPIHDIDFEKERKEKRCCLSGLACSWTFASHTVREQLSLGTSLPVFVISFGT